MGIQVYLLTLFTALSYTFFHDVYPQQAQKSNGDRIVYNNWLSVQKSVYQNSTSKEGHVYDQLSDNFYYLYKTTQNRAYLNFALHEAGKSKRDKIIESLSKNEIKSVSNVIKKLTDRKVDSSYYAIRPFSPEDLYTFLGVGIPEELKEEARNLLDHWLIKLPSAYQESWIIGSMKAQALVHGYNKLGHFKKVYEVSRNLNESHPFPESFFTYSLFNTIAYAARVQGYYSEAIHIYENIVIPIADTLGYQTWYLRVKMDYALTLFRIGQVNAALHEFEEVYAKGIQNLDARYRPALLNNLAISYLNSGRFDQYVQFQLEAFEVAKREKNYTQQLSILKNLFNYYRRQSETDLAFSYLSQALELARKNNLLSETSSMLISLGVYIREVEKAPKIALDHFYAALRYSKQSEDYQQLFNSYIDLAETYHILNDFDNAEKYLNRAMQLSYSRNDEQNYVKASIRYGNLLAESGEYEQAERIMHKISDGDLQQVPFYLKILGHNANIKLLVHNGEIEKASQLSSSVIVEIINWLQESTDMQTGHMRMDGEFSEAFRLHTTLLNKLDNREEAVTITEKLRNLSRIGFYNNPLLKSKVLSEEELIRDYNLSSRIQDLRSRYASATGDQKVYLSNEMVTAIAEKNSLQNKAFPNYTGNNFNETLPLAQKKLKSDQVIIYFTVYENQIFQFVISKTNVDVNVYPAEDKYLELVENAVSTFRQGKTNLNLLHEVYKTFYQKNIPDGVNHIYVIPDGIFYRIPAEILPVEPVNSVNSYGSTVYLLEKYSVSYLNTLSDLVRKPPSSEFKYDVAGFSVSDFTAAGHPDLPNLPFSPREVTQSVASLEQFTNNRLFISERSTETNFRKIAGKAKIIHMATHSKINDESPLFSSLYLHTDVRNDEDSSDSTASNDGIIRAYELFDLNLNADLVFLSSCESGIGGYLKGSGVLGFSRAFTYAGAQSLSINLWPIRDQAASKISVRFYEALNNGKNKAEALREARLFYLNNVNSDPYLWGAFILYGNIASPVDSNSFLNQWWISGVLITGAFFIAIFFYQKKTLIRTWLF